MKKEKSGPEKSWKWHWSWRSADIWSQWCWKIN